MKEIDVLTMRKHSRQKAKFKAYLPLFLMTIPGFIYLFINNYLPMWGLSIAFRSVDFSVGVFNSPFVGFDNFEYLFRTKDAWTITRNTVGYNLVFITLNTILGVAAALFLAEITHKNYQKVSQTLILLPHLISYIIVAYLVQAFLSSDVGMLNKSVLPALGITPKSWYTEPKYWPVILTIVNAWKVTGYQSVVFLASIVGIDPAYYEAASLDGASRWQQIRLITLPLIKTAVIMMVLLAVGRIFYSDFGLFYQVPMNSGPLFSATATIDTYVYDGLMTSGDLGMSSAAGVYQSFVGFLLVLGSNLLVRRMNPDSALF